MTLDKKLAHLRKKGGLSQAEVAEKLDVSRQAVSRWESGESRPSTENIQALCKLYHLQMESLLDDSEEDLPAAATAAPVALTSESEPDSEAPKKEKRGIIPLMIGVVAVVLVVCCIFWYVNRLDNKDGLHLSEIPGEDIPATERPTFSIALG